MSNPFQEYELNLDGVVVSIRYDVGLDEVVKVIVDGKKWEQSEPDFSPCTQCGSTEECHECQGLSGENEW